MANEGNNTAGGSSTEYYIKRLTKAGSTRYLAVGRILPPDWTDVKVYVDKLDTDICILKLENIR